MSFLRAAGWRWAAGDMKLWTSSRGLGLICWVWRRISREGWALLFKRGGAMTYRIAEDATRQPRWAMMPMCGGRTGRWATPRPTKLIGQLWQRAKRSFRCTAWPRILIDPL